MIGKKVERIFYEPTENILTSRNDVVTLREEDSLLHAILVLSNSGFQTIPVLDNKDRVRGLISISMIITNCEDFNAYNSDILNQKKVKDIMNQVVPILFNDFQLEDVLRLIIDNNFICITQRDGYFEGIITRKTILERFTNIAHNLESRYKLVAKEKTYADS
ncbi:MAG: cyclic-di-AMP-binding protein CbpB [Tissierellia bacterium]|nr:cyclic-di-AMP-binding protein CbpB [Tissierellia bacterium]